LINRLRRGLPPARRAPLADPTRRAIPARLASGEDSFERLDALLDEMKTKEKNRGRSKR
jgi:hypothetical protein